MLEIERPGRDAPPRMVDRDEARAAFRVDVPECYTPSWRS